MRLTRPKAPYDLQESDHQKLCVEYADTQPWGRYLFMIPNGTMLPGNAKTRAIYAAFLKRMGLKTGAPDLFLAWPTLAMHGAFFEMKRERGARGGIRHGLSTEQQGFLISMHIKGYYVDVCFGFDEFKTSVNQYLIGHPLGINSSVIFV